MRARAGGTKGTGASAPADEPVVWRDGVHIAGTSIWCDARRARDLCFVSRADRVSTSRHGQLIATSETLALLARRARPGGAAGELGSELAVPPARPFSLGLLRLELFRSGSALGAASLAVDTGGTRVIYAGAVNPRGGGLGGAADQRTGDVLVVEAAMGPGLVVPAIDDVAGETAALCRRVTGAGAACVLLVGGPLEGLDVAWRLSSEGLGGGELVAHRMIHHAVRRLRAAGLAPAGLEVRRLGRVKGGQVILWPVGRPLEIGGARGRGYGREALPDGSVVALVSGRAEVVGEVARVRADVALPWSTQADFAALARYVDEVGASSVYVTGPAGEAAAEALARAGRRVRALGPPVQMSLFA